MHAVEKITDGQLIDNNYMEKTFEDLLFEEFLEEISDEKCKEKILKVLEE